MKADSAEAQVKTTAENLETMRTRAREQTEALRVKAQEIEAATQQKAVDDVSTFHTSCWKAFRSWVVGVAGGPGPF